MAGDLWHRAGSALCGRFVRVYFRMPVVKGAGGAVYLDVDGTPVIEIKPGNSKEFTLHVLCHEAAHIVSGDLDGGSPGCPDGNLRINRDAWRNSPRESHRNAQAQEWLDYADVHCHKYSGDWTQQRLRALIFMSFQDIMDKAIAEGARKALEELPRKRG